MKIVLTGPKCSGKSKIGKPLADFLAVSFYETDAMIEELYRARMNSTLSCRTICAQHGEDYFRSLEKEVIEKTASFNNCVILTGGSTMLNRNSRILLRQNSILVLLTASPSILLNRLLEKEIPSFLNNKESQDLFVERAAFVSELIKPYADIFIDSSAFTFEQTFEIVKKELIDFGSSLLNVWQAKAKFIKAFSENGKKIKNSDILKTLLQI